MLERHFKGKSPDQIRRFIGDATAGNFEHYIRIMAWYDGYIQEYPEEEFDVVAVEQSFAVPLLDPETGKQVVTGWANGEQVEWAFQGKVDGLIRDKEGLLWLLEHKTRAGTSSRVTLEDYFARLQWDAQISLYGMAMSEVYGEKVYGTLYDVVQKLKRRRKNAGKFESEETDEAYAKRIWRLYQKKGSEPAHDKVAGKLFARELVPLRPDVGLRALGDICRVVRHIAQSAEEGFVPNRQACFNFGSKCQYWKLCHTHDVAGAIEMSYQRKEAHSELL